MVRVMGKKEQGKKDWERSILNRAKRVGLTEQITGCHLESGGLPLIQQWPHSTCPGGGYSTYNVCLHQQNSLPQAFLTQIGI